MDTTPLPVDAGLGDPHSADPVPRGHRSTEAEAHRVTHTGPVKRLVVRDGRTAGRKDPRSTTAPTALTRVPVPRPAAAATPAGSQRRRTRFSLRSVAGGLAAAAIVSCAACTGAASGQLGDLQSIAERCGDTHRLSVVASDESGSSRGSTARPDRQQVLRDEMTRTAVCGGRFRATVFSGSVVGQVVLDTALSTSGETQTARLRKVPKLVDQSMSQLNAALSAARAQLPAVGTDTTAQYQAAAEFFAQAGQPGTTTQLAFTVLTDGITTATPGLTDPSLSVERAGGLARSAAPARLPGVSVRLIGVGRTADPAHPLPSTYVNALKAFQLGACQRSDARSCLVVTDPEAGDAK